MHVSSFGKLATTAIVDSKELTSFISKGAVAQAYPKCRFNHARPVALWLNVSWDDTSSEHC